MIWILTITWSMLWPNLIREWECLGSHRGVTYLTCPILQKSHRTFLKTSTWLHSTVLTLLFLIVKLPLKPINRFLSFFLTSKQLSAGYKGDCLLWFVPHCSLSSSGSHYAGRHHLHPHPHCCYCCCAPSCWMQTLWRGACLQDCGEEILPLSLWGFSQPHRPVGEPLLRD